MEDIYLFGAGQKGRYWLRCLKSFGVMPSGFIDNNPELAGSLVDGVQVYGAAHSKAFSSGYILVTCNDEEEICRQLLELEFPEEKIVHGLHNITNHILYYAVNRIPSISSGRNTRKSLSGRKVLFDLQNGMVLGGVEAWSYELAGRLCQQGIQGMYLTTETGLQRVGQAVYPVQVFRFEQPLEERERIETYVEGITEHLPCTVICNFPWYIFWAACIARKRYPDQVRIIAVQHSDDATYYKSYGLWKEYIDKCLTISSLIEKKILSCGVEGEKLARLEWKVPCEEKLDRMWSPEDRRLQIGYAGRITVTQKRVDLLPVLAAELRRRGVCFQMNIAGTGNYAEALEEKIKEETCRIMWYWRVILRERPFHYFGENRISWSVAQSGRGTVFPRPKLWREGQYRFSQMYPESGMMWQTEAMDLLLKWGMWKLWQTESAGCIVIVVC